MREVLPELLEWWRAGEEIGVGTVVATMIIARRQIDASRDEADRVIAATREQTDVAAGI